MPEFASKGVAGSGLGLGIAGTALGVLNGGLGRVLGGLGNPTVVSTPATTGCCGDISAVLAGAMAGMGMGALTHGNGCSCSEDRLVNRYEAAKDARIAELETEVKLRDANTYTDQKILATYQYIDGQLKDVRDTLCAQAVHNQRTEDSFALARQDIAAVKRELCSAIELEAERRCCADNSIVNYANATFYPKMVADVTVGTETTAQSLYNPIPKCGCCKG